MPEKAASPSESGPSLESVDARIQQLEYDNALLRATMERISAENEAELRIFQETHARLTAAERTVTELQSQKQEWGLTAESLRQELAAAATRTEELEDRLRIASAHNSPYTSPDRGSAANSVGESVDPPNASFFRSELTASLAILREENQRLHDQIYMLEMDAVQQKVLRKRERDHHSSAVRETATMFADRVRELEAMNRDNTITIQQLLDEIRRLEDTVDELSHSPVHSNSNVAGEPSGAGDSGPTSAPHSKSDSREHESDVNSGISSTSSSSGTNSTTATSSSSGTNSTSSSSNHGEGATGGTGATAAVQLARARSFPHLYSAADTAIPAAGPVRSAAATASTPRAGGASWSVGGVSNSASPVCGDSDTDSGQHEGFGSRSGGDARGRLDVDTSTLDAVRAARLLLSPQTRAALGFGARGQPRVSGEGDSELQLQCLLASSEAAVSALQSDLARIRGLLREREGQTTALEAQLARARRGQGVQCLCLGGRCSLWPCRVLRQPLAHMPDRELTSLSSPAVFHNASSVALMPYGRRLSFHQVLQRLSDGIFVASCAGLAAASLSHPERIIVDHTSIAAVLSLSMLTTFPLSGRALWLDAVAMIVEGCTGYATDAMIGVCC
jgi:hypothetical protein